jgi:endonuclease YncB( thermonuclease family)
MTTDFDKEMIQTGWSVWTADGQELGTIIATDASSMKVKKKGFRGGEVQVPRDKVDEVETGRVELSLTKTEVEAVKG